MKQKYIGNRKIVKMLQKIFGIYAVIVYTTFWFKTVECKLEEYKQEGEEIQQEKYVHFLTI